jgi:hypothetical protein
VATPAHRVDARRSRLKESFYVRVEQSDGAPFFPATDYVGKDMPFDNPRGTCGVRVYPGVVTLNIQHFTKRAAKAAKERKLEFPDRALTRLSKVAAEVGAIEPGTIVVERDNVRKVVPIEVSDNGIVTFPDAADSETYERDVRGERVSVYLQAGARADLVIAVGYSGHLGGAPGTPESLHAAAAKILNAALGVPEFRVLSQLATVEVPPLPARQRMVRPDVASLTVEWPVRLYTDPSTGAAPELVAAGSILVEFDLEHAHAANERLLYRLHPQGDLADHLAAYQAIVDRYLVSKVEQLLPGDELRGVVFDIVLGEVSQGTVERLRELLSQIPPVDFTPAQYRENVPVV